MYFTFNIPNGKMEINPKTFFPCTKTELKKLIKTSGYDPELVENLDRYLRQCIEDNRFDNKLKKKYEDLLQTLRSVGGGR